MYKIRYYYTSLSKQFFLLSLVAALAVRLTLFFVGGFAAQAYVGPTVAAYAAGLLICAFFFFGWRFFYCEFTEKEITQYNRLLGRKQQLDLMPVERALFSKGGISLYYNGDEKPRMFIPFRRFGVVSPVGVENFMNLMKNHRVEVEQTYQVLPGYDRLSRWFSGGYVILTIAVLINTFQLGLLVFAILSSGGIQ